MGGSLAKNKAAGLWTASLKILVVGSKNCGKTTIIRRYIANQFIAGNEDSQSESQKILQAAQLFTHTLKVPGRHEVVSITFWEIPSNPLEYMKKQYYSGADAALIVVDSERSGGGGIEEIMMEAQDWKAEISNNYPKSDDHNTPMMVLVNKKDGEAAAVHAGRSSQDDSDFGYQTTAYGEMTQEQLMELATNNGFNSCLKVHPHTGDESVLRAVDSLLRLLMEKRSKNLTTDLPYPTHAHCRV